MITEKRCVLLPISGKERLIEKLEKFEGISVIRQEKEIPLVWSRNKTPVYVGDSEIEGIQVPDFEENFIENFTKWSHKNGFECGEYQTGVKINTRNEPCILCSIASHGGYNNNTMVYNQSTKNEVDCIIYESKSFYVTSELGSLKTGYLMIVPKEHKFLSIAQMDRIYFDEYHEVEQDIESILKGALGAKKVTFFEHGSSPSGFSSHPKSIVHAHVHVVADFEIEKKYLDMIQMKPLADITKANQTHYFAYKVGSKGMILCCYDDEVYVQRQFPRQIMAKQLGYSPNQYNWRKFEFDENVHTTLYYLHKYLSTSKLNSRIKDRTYSFVEGYKAREDFEE